MIIIQKVKEHIYRLTDDVKVCYKKAASDGSKHLTFDFKKQYPQAAQTSIRLPVLTDFRLQKVRVGDISPPSEIIVVGNGCAFRATEKILFNI